MPRTVDRQDVADREPPPSRHRPRVLGAVIAIGLVMGVVMGLVGLFGLFGLSVTVARLDPEDGPVPAADPSSRLSQWQEDIEDLKDAEAVRILAEHYADSHPALTGPWPVTVVEDSSMGLEVRNRHAGGHPVGAASFGTTLWAWCRIESGSGPDGGGGGGGWYQVAWPHQDRSGEFLVPTPDDEYRAWVHRRPTVPAGHSRDIPTCQE